MFSIGLLELFRKFLKSAPYFIFASLIVFGVVKLKSCEEELSKTKKEVVTAKKETQNEKDAVVKQANQENTQAINNLGKSSQVTLDSVSNQFIEEKKIYKTAGDRELKVKQQLSKVLDDYNSSVKNLDASKLKDSQISTIQINSIWQTYCGMTTDDIQCKDAS